MPQLGRVAVVVEMAWDPASVEVDAAGRVDLERVVAEPTPGSLEVVDVGLELGEVRVFGIGAVPTDDLLRTCLAMGAATIASAPDVFALAAALTGTAFDLVLAPQRSGDGGASPIGPALAGLLDLPQATAIESLRIEGGTALVMRRLDRGEREELAVTLPAVIALEPDVCRPRTASPAELLAAQSAPVPRLAAVPGPTARFLDHVGPRPAPPRLRFPDPSASAEIRIAEVVGTAEDGRAREVATGSPEELAGRIVRLLRERGYI